MTVRPSEPPVVARPWLVLGAGVVLAVHTTLLLVAGAAWPAVQTVVLDLDARVHGWAAGREGGVLIAASHVFALVGSVWVTAPLRVVVGLALAWRRWWWRLGAWVGSIALSEVVVTAMKDGYDRARPPLALEATRSAAFPSGHSAAAAVTVLCLVVLLAPQRRRERRLQVAAGLVVVAMAVSRVVLRVHWVADVVVGVLVGAAAGLIAIGLAAVGQAALSSRRQGRASDGPRP